MSAVSNYEKQSLEAHVDLCAERFSNLQDDLGIMGERIVKLESDMAKRMDKLETIVVEIKENLAQKETSALRSLVVIGLSTIASLLGLSGALVWYIITHQ